MAAGMVLAVVGLASPVGAQGNDDPGPPGDNGTVKIDGLGLDDGPGHSGQPNDPDETDPDTDPHVECGFQVEFFNFDSDQTADITFTAHPPTGQNGVLLDQTGVTISTDGTAGAPNDVDEVFDYDVLTDFDLTQFTSVHPVHGWHVKLDITIYDAEGKKVPGGQKHKVFWVEGCAPDPECSDTSGDAVAAIRVDEVDPCDPPQCPPGTVGGDVNENGELDEGECDTPECPDEDADLQLTAVVVDEVEDPCDPPQCPPGTVGGDANENGELDEGECDTPGDACPNLDGFQESTRECPPPPPFDECPLIPGNQAAGTDCTPPPPVDECPDDAGLQTSADQCTVNEVEPQVVVATPAPVAPAPIAVQGEVISRAAPVQLPRTGTDTKPLIEIGVGLVLLGAGAMLFGRERTASI
jgi:hypothetical protein